MGIKFNEDTDWGTRNTGRTDSKFAVPHLKSRWLKKQSKTFKNSGFKTFYS